MQRGALVRPSRERDDGKYPGLKIQMTKGEYPNFEFGQQTLDVTINRLQPLVRSYAKAGFRKPVDVARLLNKAGEKTACGQPWSPRLVALLLSRMFTGSFERAIVPTTSLPVHSAPASTKKIGARPAKSASAKMPVGRRPEMHGRAGATTLAEKLSAIGRVMRRNQTTTKA